jgi:hypothetical protein
MAEEATVSLRSLIDVTTKLMTDGDFRNLLVNDPNGALEQFNLSPEEIQALKTRDRWLLEECGLEEWTARWVSALR